MRVLANLLDLPGFDFESSQDVLKKIPDLELIVDKLSNATQASIQLSSGSQAKPAAATIYQLDSLVRRAPSLQLTTDALDATVSEPSAEELSA